MPDPRLVGLHELKALINKLNDANLRVSHAAAHFTLVFPPSRVDFEELSSIKSVIEDDLLPRCVQLLRTIEGDTAEN